MNAAAGRRWSEHQPVQPNDANVVPETPEAAAEFFRCLTYRCGMMGQGCAARFQKRAAGPVLGQVDHLNGCHECAAGQARATLLDAAPAAKVKHVGIARGNPIRSKFQPVLATRADRNLASETSLLDPCAECHTPRTRTTKRKASGPYSHLCERCAGRARYRVDRAKELARRSAESAFLGAVNAALDRLRSAREVAADAWVLVLSDLAVRESVLAAPFAMPTVPVLFVPAGPCAGCGRARKYDSPAHVGRPDLCRRCNEKARAVEVAQEQPAERGPLAPCSSCGAERHFTQKRRRPIGDPTRCSKCNKHVFRALRRAERRAEKGEALKVRLNDAEAGLTQACPRCLRENRAQDNRAGSPVEPFCSTCLQTARRCLPGADDAGLLAWLVAHPSRLDQGVPCRGCGAMRHAVGEGINGGWCSRCRKNATNSVIWHGQVVTEETLHQRLLRSEQRWLRSKVVPTDRVAEAVTSATTEAVSESGQGRAVYFDPTLFVIQASGARWRKAVEAVQFWANRESEYLGGAA